MARSCNFIRTSFPRKSCLFIHRLLERFIHNFVVCLHVHLFVMSDNPRGKFFQWDRASVRLDICESRIFLQVRPLRQFSDRSNEFLLIFFSRVSGDRGHAHTPCLDKGHWCGFEICREGLCKCYCLVSRRLIENLLEFPIEQRLLVFNVSNFAVFRLLRVKVLTS